MARKGLVKVSQAELGQGMLNWLGLKSFTKAQKQVLLNCTFIFPGTAKVQLYPPFM